MIIMLSLVGILLLLITIIILGCTVWDWDCQFDLTPGLLAILAIVIGGATIGCGICCIIENSCPEVKIVEIEEKISYLENRREMLESVKPIITSDGEILELTSDIYLHFDNVQEYYKAVDEYNQELKEFNIEIKSNRYKRNNPLISWFITPAYNMIDMDRVDSLSYTLGK